MNRQFSAQEWCDGEGNVTACGLVNPEVHIDELPCWVVGVSEGGVECFVGTTDRIVPEYAIAMVAISPVGRSADARAILVMPISCWRCISLAIPPVVIEVNMSLVFVHAGATE
jgi:hypothetical protein